MKPKKGLGQHFLTAPAIAKKIAESVPAERDDCVLEIGPGRGAVSVHLARRFRNLHFLELDKDAIDVLKKKLCVDDDNNRGDVIYNSNTRGDKIICDVCHDNDRGNITIHNGDAKKFEFAKIKSSLHVVGNLPYNVGAAIIKNVLLHAPQILSCTFMVQKEVAQRIAASSSTKDNGFLTIFCQFFGAANLLFHVPPGAFFPKPAVDSSVFQINVCADVEKKLAREKWNDFFAFVSAGFSMRRKQLPKILSMRFERPKEFYESALAEINVGAMSRPEDLDVEKWIALYKQVNHDDA